MIAPFEPDDAHPDPMVEAAIREAETHYAKAKDRWPAAGEDEAAEAAEDAAYQARDAVARLRAGAWDEAEALAQGAVELDENWRDGETWRHFAILVEEAAALGRES